MTKAFVSDEINQSLMMPPSLHDWLLEHHLARFVADLTPSLDLTAFYASYEEKDAVFSVLPVGFIAIAFMALSSGTVGVGGLVVGCAMMMRDTRLAVQSLAEETQLAAQRSNHP